MSLFNYTCSSSRSVRQGLLLTAALIAPGCQLAFGTYSGNVSQETGGTTGAGGTAAGGESTVGGAASSGGDTTGTGGAADSGGCSATDNCLKCSKTDPSYCGAQTDAGTPLFVCEDERQGFIQYDTCGGNVHCEPGVNYCVACKANETHCVPDKVTLKLTGGKRCNSDQTGWDEYPCKNGLCEPDAGIGTPDRCDICSEGSTQCVSITNGTGTLFYKKTCVSADWQTEKCQLGCQAANSNGDPAVCINSLAH